VIIIRPNCLKVDKAINFLKSYSEVAPRPVINTVKPEIKNKKIFNHKPKEGLKRMSKEPLFNTSSPNFRAIIKTTTC
jgi:hypothetical protein